MFQNASSLKPLGQLKPNCPGMIIGSSSTRCVFFYADGKSKMATTTEHILTLDPIGKSSIAFFSETTNQTESKLDRNVHWMVLYKAQGFCSDIKWKMATTAGISLTLDPINCPGMIIGRSSIKFWFCMTIRNPRWPPPQEID